MDGNTLCVTLPVLWDSFQCLNTSYCTSSLFPQRKRHSDGSQQIVCCASRAFKFLYLLEVLSSNKQNFHQTLRSLVLCRDCLSCDSLLADFCHKPAGQQETLLPPLEVLASKIHETGDELLSLPLWQPCPPKWRVVPSKQELPPAHWRCSFEISVSGLQLLFTSFSLHGIAVMSVFLHAPCPS